MRGECASHAVSSLWTLCGSRCSSVHSCRLGMPFMRSAATSRGRTEAEVLSARYRHATFCCGLLAVVAFDCSFVSFFCILATSVILHVCIQIVAALAPCRNIKSGNKTRQRTIWNHLSLLVVVIILPGVNWFSLKCDHNISLSSLWELQCHWCPAMREQSVYTHLWRQ